MTEDIRSPWSGRSWVWRLTAIGAAVAIALIALPRAAWAKDVSIAIYVEGADAAAIRNTLLVSVPAGTTVAEADTFSTALAQKGQKLPFGKALEGGARDRTAGKVRTALASSGLDGALLVRVVKEKTERAVKWLFVSASRSESPRDGEVALGPKRSKEDTGKLKAFVESALGGTQEAAAAPVAAAEKPATAAEKPAAKPAAAPEEAAPSPAAEPESKPAPAESAASTGADMPSGRPHGSIGRSLFQVEVGAEAAGRSFTLNQNWTGNIRSFSAMPVAMFNVNGEAYPLADGKGFLGDIGIVGSYSQSLFLSSQVTGGPNINTTESAYFVGLRVRIHPTSDPGLIIGVSDGYASQTVSFSGATGMLATQLPAVGCSGNRLAVDARIPMGKISFRAGLGYRLIFDGGALAARFPHGSSEGGIDAELGAGYEVARGWEVRAIVDYERYFYSFTPKPGDTYVAGGALDQFYGGRVALAYIF
jgi:hypothetical protein